MISLPEKYNYLDINSDFEKIINLITTTDKNLFITGPAGTGKSTLLKIIMDDQVVSGRKVLLASTGIASMNASSEEFKGSTIHSFLKLPGMDVYTRSMVTITDKVKAVASKVDIVVIDEVSMMNNSLFDIVIYLMKIYKEGDLPRFFLFGDPFQLPPVINKKDESVKKYFNEMYDGNYFFFNSFAFKDLGFETIHLNKIYRQKEGSFQNILNRIRQGIIENSDLSILNERCLPETTFMMEDEVPYIYLATTNNTVNDLNSFMLSHESGKQMTYHAFVTGRFDMSKKKMIEEVITLKEGCQIMITANSLMGIDPPYYNGMLGKVLNLSSNSAIVESNSGEEIRVEPNCWKNYEYEFEESTNEIVAKEVGRLTQMSLKLAYALTTHKSQGLTLDRAFIDFENFVFADGLCYVALSRLRDIKGLGLKRAIKPKDIKVNKEVMKFFEGI